MHSKEVTLLILFCYQLLLITAKLQLHPKFEVRQYTSKYIGDFFTGSSLADWTPNRQTVLYQLERRSTPKLTIVAKIEDLLSKDDFLLKFWYKCSQSGKEQVVQLRHPFQMKNRLICKSTLPLSIETKQANWISDTVYHLRLEVKVAGQTKVPLDQALTHYVKIRMAFIGPHWSLKSNGLFIRNWDALFQGSSGRGKRVSFLSNEAMLLLKHMNYIIIGKSEFTSQEFIHSDIAYLIKNASEFVQSTIGIGAILNMDMGACDRLNPRTQMAFMSSQHFELYQFSSTKIMRLDSATGKLTYSRHGLRALVYSSYYRDKLGHGWTEVCDYGRRECQTDALCPRLEYMPINKPLPYLFTNSASRIRRPKYSVAKMPPMNNCKVLNQKRVLIFARTLERSVICPIICANHKQQFEFYKGKVRLLPKSGPDFTKVGAVSVHKSGTAVLFTQFITHKDAGEYMCTAGGKVAKFMVDIVALPLFSVRATAWEGGDLPPITYARIHHGYALNCTVFYSGMRSVSLTPEFYVVADKRTNTWSKLSEHEFARHTRSHSSKVTISTSKTPHSTTLSLQVSRVPRPSSAFDFSHRYVCNAAISPQDATRFGVTEYNVQSGSQVVVVTITAPDIEFSASPSCTDRCARDNCVITYALKRDVYKNMKYIGLNVCARYKAANWKLSPDVTKQVKYDKDGAALVLTVKPACRMTGEERKALVSLVPVFEYFVQSKATSRDSSVQCTCAKNGLHPLNPACIVATTEDLEEHEQESLQIEEQLKLNNMLEKHHLRLMHARSNTAAVSESDGSYVNVSLAAILICLKSTAALG